MTRGQSAVRRALRVALPGALPLLAAVALLAACATAPGTGRSFFTGGLSQGDEAKLGAEEHDKIVAEFGGVYRDAALARYVSSIGDLLVRTSETPEQKFTFTVLNTPIVNAFALPGGYVYVTRGLIALADDEAELAGVIAHEIGHVTARHTAERYGQAMAAKIGQIGLGLLFGGEAANAFGSVSALALRSFSRDQEHEADGLGVRYMSRAGYDPGAMASFLTQLQADSALQAALLGQPGKADEFNIMQTHPRTAERIERTVQEAQARSVRDPMRGRDVYLDKIDGLLYDDDPAQGFVRGRRFLHPELRFGFEVPEGFRPVNGRAAVTARGPDGAAILFDRAKTPWRGAMTDYLTRVWAEGVRLEDVEALSVNGLAAATGRVEGRTGSGPVVLRLVAFRHPDGAIYRMLFVAPAAQAAAFSVPFRRTTYSFRVLSAGEAAALRPHRLRVVTVRPGDTVARLAARLPYADDREARFRALNGLAPGARLQPGRRVKTIVE